MAFFFRTSIKVCLITRFLKAIPFSIYSLFVQMPIPLRSAERKPTERVRWGSRANFRGWPVLVHLCLSAASTDAHIKKKKKRKKKRNSQTSLIRSHLVATQWDAALIRSGRERINYGRRVPARMRAATH